MKTPQNLLSSPNLAMIIRAISLVAWYPQNYIDNRIRVGDFRPTVIRLHGPDFENFRPAPSISLPEKDLRRLKFFYLNLGSPKSSKTSETVPHDLTRLTSPHFAVDRCSNMFCL